MSLFWLKGFTFASMQGKDLSEAASNRECIERIKSLYLRGRINREVAKALAQPTIDRINKRSLEIAKRHGKRSYPKVSFAALMR